MAHVSRKLFKSKNGKNSKPDSKSGIDDDYGNIISSSNYVASSASSQSSTLIGSSKSSSSSTASSLFESVRSRPSSVIATGFASLKQSSRGHKHANKNRDSIKDSGFLTNTISNSHHSSTFTNSSSASNISSPSITPLQSNNRNSARTPGTSANSVSSPNSTEDFPHLTICHLPFELDLYETFQTLCDVLIDVYRRLYTFVKLSQSATEGSSFTASRPGGSLSTVSSNTSNSTSSGNSSNGSVTDPNVITNDTFAMLLKVDDLLKRLVLGPTIRGIDAISKNIVYEESKRLDRMLRDTQ